MDVSEASELIEKGNWFIQELSKLAPYALSLTLTIIGILIVTGFMMINLHKFANKSMDALCKSHEAALSVLKGLKTK